MKVNIVMAKKTTLMALKGSGVTSREDWLNMFGDIIIEMIVYNYRKNSFLNNLKGAIVSGSFTTLSII